MTTRRLGPLTLIACLLCSAAAWGQASLSIEVGWQGVYRMGAWTPLFITATADAPRQVLADVYTPAGGPNAMRVSQGFVIGPEPTTYILYVPLPDEYELARATVTLRDARTGRRLAFEPMADEFGRRTSIVADLRTVRPGQLMVGLSGRTSDIRQVAGQLDSSALTCGILPQRQLPAAAAGYSALDLLMLSAPDFTTLDTDQQQAIADWVRAGGSLVLWPGADAVPTTGPLIDLLPVHFGDNAVFQVPGHLLQPLQLTERFGSLRGRELTPAGDAMPVTLFGDGGPTGYRRSAGYGQVLVLPVDLVSLRFGSSELSYQFWRPVLSGLLDLPDLSDADAAQSLGYSQSAQVDAARNEALNWLGDVPGTGTFGFSYVAGALVAMMLIVGPVDWIVLKRLGRQPWTWVTTTGWIGLVTLGAVLAGGAIKSGDLYYRSLRLIDEAHGLSAEIVDMVGIYSPRTRGYEMDFDPQSWWKPASVGYYRSDGMLTELTTHQDYLGTRPTDDLRISIWSLRFLEATTTVRRPALIEAHLRREGSKLVGTITNRADRPLKDLHIRTAHGTAHLGSKSIDAGEVLSIDQPLVQQGGPWLRLLKDPSDSSWRDRSQSVPGSRPTPQTVGGLTMRRSLRIEAMMDADSDDQAPVAVVFAELADPSPPALLKAGGAIEQHMCLVRSLTKLEPAH